MPWVFPEAACGCPQCGPDGEAEWAAAPSCAVHPDLPGRVLDLGLHFPGRAPFRSEH